MKMSSYGPYVNQDNSTSTNLNVTGPIEDMNITSATLSGTATNIDCIASTFWLFTANPSANFSLNLRGNSTTPMNSLLAIGQSISLVIAVTNGTTPYYLTALSIDGTSVTAKWLNAGTPASGNASSIDAYSLTVIKTAANTYTVLGAGASKFA